MTPINTIPSKIKWLILLTICLDWSLMWIDFTAVNVALGPIANDLHTSLATLQWVITAYTLCSAAFMTIGGRLGDSFGHSRLFIIGTFIFVISSALAGFATDASSLILSRVGQGIGIALVVPITTALVYLTFDRAQKGLALGFLTGTTGVSMAIGPTVGGLLITYLNWRWVFFINIPIGLLAIIMAIVLIPKNKKKKKKIRIDFLGVVTLASGLFCLLLALNKASVWGIFSANFMGLLLIAVLLLAAFVFIESKVKEPLIHLELLRDRALMSVITIRTFAQYIFFVFMFVLSLYLENILNYRANEAGYLLLCATIVLGIFSPFAGKLINYFSLRTLIATSCILLALSLASLIHASGENSLSYLYLSLILFGAAFAIHFPITNYTVLHLVPSNQAALVTGILFTMAFSGASAGIAISSSLLSTFSHYQVNQILTLENIQLTPAQLSVVHNVASGAQSINDLSQLLPGNIVNLISLVTQEGFIYGFNWVLTVCVILAVLGLLIAIFFLHHLVVRKDVGQSEIILE